MKKPAVGAAQKDMECGVISCMKKIEKICQEKENIFTHQGNIKKMARQQNKMVITTSPLLPTVEKKTSKHEGGSSLTGTRTSAEWEDLNQKEDHKLLNY